MADVHWPDETLFELNEIIAYIEQRNPAAANRLQQRLLALGNSLRFAPHRGRLMARGVRQLVTVPPYILRYRVEGDDVIIVGVRHSARRPLA